MDSAGGMAVFVGVVEAQNFSAAARNLKLTPSAVSKLIGRLENRLGARLLNRTTRQVSLTDEGRTYYQSCLPILAAIEDAEHAVSKLHDAPRGLLKVNASTAFGISQALVGHADTRMRKRKRKPFMSGNPVRVLSWDRRSVSPRPYVGRRTSACVWRSGSLAASAQPRAGYANGLCGTLGRAKKGSVVRFPLTAGLSYSVFC